MVSPLSQPAVAQSKVLLAPNACNVPALSLNLYACVKVSPSISAAPLPVHVIIVEVFETAGNNEALVTVGTSFTAVIVTLNVLSAFAFCGSVTLTVTSLMPETSCCVVQSTNWLLSITQFTIELLLCVWIAYVKPASAVSASAANPYKSN